MFRVSSQKAADLRRFLSRYAKSNGIDADTLARLPLSGPAGLAPLVLPGADRAALDPAGPRRRPAHPAGRRAQEADHNPAWEITGVPDQLISELSCGRAAVMLAGVAVVATGQLAVRSPSRGDLAADAG